MNKRACYPCDWVCVVHCVSPIVSASCESGGKSSSWLLSQLWQDVLPPRRASVRATLPVLAFRGVLFFVWDWVCMCAAFVVVSSHIHVSLPLWPPATFCISLWLLQLHPFPGSPQLEAPTYPQRMRVNIWAYVVYVCVCMCIRVSVYPVIVANGTITYQLYCLGVTLSADSLLYE